MWLPPAVVLHSVQGFKWPCEGWVMEVCKLWIGKTIKLHLTWLIRSRKRWTNSSVGSILTSLIKKTASSTYQETQIILWSHGRKNISLTVNHLHTLHPIDTNTDRKYGQKWKEKKKKPCANLREKSALFMKVKENFIWTRKHYIVLDAIYESAMTQKSLKS